MKSLIIDRPCRMSLRQKYTDNILKIFMLLGWFYFVIPAITFGVWYLAYTFFDQHIYLLEGYKEYNTSTSFWYLVIIANMLVLILAWSKGMQFFSKKMGEDKSATLSIGEMSEYYQVKEENIACYRTMKNMVVSIAEQGKISLVEKSEVVPIDTIPIKVK